MESARRAFNQWREMPTLARGALLLAESRTRWQSIAKKLAQLKVSAR